MTHKLAGPLFSITREMRKIGLGKVGMKVNLRTDDELKYLMRCFNEMSEISEICQGDVDKIGSILDKMTDENSKSSGSLCRFLQFT